MIIGIICGLDFTTWTYLPKFPKFCRFLARNLAAILQCQSHALWDADWLFGARHTSEVWCIPSMSLEGVDMWSALHLNTTKAQELWVGNYQHGKRREALQWQKMSLWQDSEVLWTTNPAKCCDSKWLKIAASFAANPNQGSIGLNWEGSSLVQCRTCSRPEGIETNYDYDHQHLCQLSCRMYCQLSHNEQEIVWKCIKQQEIIEFGKAVKNSGPTASLNSYGITHNTHDIHPRHSTSPTASAHKMLTRGTTAPTAELDYGTSKHKPP